MPWRSPRIQLADIMPAVLRLPDGFSHRGKLETVSLTGGLLSVSSTLDQGSRIKLMFLTRTGPVLGLAEMLSPVSDTRQPFRFVALDEGNRHRLRTVIQSSLFSSEEAWIEKYRTAAARCQPAPRRILRPALTLLTLFGSAVYLFHAYPLW